MNVEKRIIYFYDSLNAALPLAEKKKGYDMDWMVQHLPAEIQTKLMIHFKASDLVAFLDAH